MDKNPTSGKQPDKQKQAQIQQQVQEKLRDELTPPQQEEQKKDHPPETRKTPPCDPKKQDASSEAPKEDPASEAPKQDPASSDPAPSKPPEHPWETVYRQFQQARKRFPQLDLVKEMENPAFGRLIATGFPVETAYELVHLKEMIGRAMAQVARQTALEMTQALQSGSLRPREGALGGAQGGVCIRDPRYFTQQQRQDYRNRAMRGERVIF